jgi:hypothetical protein
MPSLAVVNAFVSEGCEGKADHVPKADRFLGELPLVAAFNFSSSVDVATVGTHAAVCSSSRRSKAASSFDLRAQTVLPTLK